jgi:hypothetical protein
MLKTIDIKNSTGLMKIKSAFTASAPGFIYVEAVNETFAKEALQGLRQIYLSSFSQLPITEMTSVLTVNMTVMLALGCAFSALYSVLRFFSLILLRVALHRVALHRVALHRVALHCVALHRVASLFAFLCFALLFASSCVASHCFAFALLCVALSFALRCIASRQFCVALHY